MEAGHWKRAREIAESRLRGDANDAQARLWLSKAKASFGDLEGAIEEAERAVALAPNNADYRSQLAESCALMADKSAVVKGLIYMRRMKKEIAATLALNPKHVDTLLMEMVFSAKAPALAGGGKKLADRIADELVGIAPVWGYLGHARLLQEHGPDNATEMWLQKAILAEPTFYRARISLARFYCCMAQNKRFDAAERVAKDALALDPSAAGAYEILAGVYAAGQRWGELDDILARAERAVPDDLAPYYAASRALLEIGQDFRRGERYVARYLSQATEGRQPTHAEARLLLATMYEREGRKADAMRELQAAIRLQPDFEPAKAGLKRLRNS